MDIKKLNEFLAPYKIEIACDSCQKTSEQKSKNRTQRGEESHSIDIPGSERRTFPKPPKTQHPFSQTKKIKQNEQLEAPRIGAQKPLKTDSGIFQSYLGHVQKMAPFSRSSLLFNPPNQILNLNCFAGEIGRKPGIAELLETHRNTPNKIEEDDIDRFYHSEKKQGVFKPHFTNSTAQPMFFCPEESPISSHRQTKNHWSEQLYFDGLAQGGMPSRDPSPFQTPYRRNPETPSYVDRTPRNQSQLTPNMRGLDNYEEGDTENFNLLENPFEEKL